MDMKHQIQIVSLILSTSLVISYGAHIDVTKKGMLSTMKPLTHLSYNELAYIYETRNGITQKPDVTLSPCARAILGCCNGKVMGSACSEGLGCGSFFFDDNPCSDQFIVEALKAARYFYEFAQRNDVDSSNLY